MNKPSKHRATYFRNAFPFTGRREPVSTDEARGALIQAWHICKEYGLTAAAAAINRKLIADFGVDMDHPPTVYSSGSAA